MKIHDEIEDWMAAALCEALTPEEQKNFEQHLAECPHCRSLYEETQKMNEILNHTLPELRPDQNFERRVIAGFREKIAGGGFHPWRGLVWLAQFRAAQAAFAMLILAAMVKMGTVLTGEKYGAQPTDIVLADNAVDKVIAQIPQGTTGRSYFLSPPTVTTKSGQETTEDLAAQLSSGNVAWVSQPGMIYSGTTSDTRTRYRMRLGNEITLGSGTAQVNTTGTGSLALTKAYIGTTAGSAFVKSGAGAVTFGATTSPLTLTGSNTYSGATSINSGALVISGTVSGAGGQAHGNRVTSVNQGESKLAMSDKYVSGDMGFTASNDYLSRGINKDAQASVERAAEHEIVRRQEAIHAEKAKNYAQNGSGVITNRADDTEVVSGTDSTPVDNRKLIRNGTLEFEIPSFEKAADTIADVAREEKGYIATQNSDRGSNGKLQGRIVVKVLPANLDRFLLKLRALGDLKNQTVETEDVTKAYFDTEARMRNAKTMEGRLVDMLKKNTGRVSDLLEVEREIARVREEIEKMQGELKYMDAEVQFATITIALQEKDIDQTAAYLLKEHANLALFAKDVEQAFAEAKGDAEAAKAQTVESHIERDAYGRVSATLHLLISPETSEETINKLKALGHIQNFNSQTQRVARDGSGKSDAAKVERDKVELNLLIQHDEENAVQGTNIAVLTDHVEEKTAQIKQAAAAAGIEVKGAEFNRAQNGVEISGMLLRMPMQKYAAFLEHIKGLGKVKDFTVSRREDAGMVSDTAPIEIGLQIFNQGNIVPDANGFLPTIRRTLGQGVGALMWSVRMIGVTLAFIAPWAIALCAVVWIVIRRRRAKKV